MKSASLCGVSLSVLLMLSGTVFGQPGGGGGRRGGGSRLPAVGTLLPEVNVFDESGNEFSTKVLRVHYTVLVFGCLT